jgi:hypothetical protein
MGGTVRKVRERPGLETPPPREARVLRQALAALTSARKELADKDRRLKALEGRLDQLDRSLEKSTGLTSASDVFEGGLGRRAAVEQYRNTNLARFMRSVNELGVESREHGREVARFSIRTAVRADLACLFAAGPRSVEEAELRDLLRVLLSNPASASVLAGIEPWHERFREDLINLALNAGVETSTWEFVRRSAEETEVRTREGSG